MTSGNALPGQVGTVAALWRFPVKSMRGELLERAELSEAGVLGDRAYALLDTETGTVVSAKHGKLFPGLFRCQARFLAPPRRGEELPPVEITLPDGTAVSSAAADVDRRLSACLGREVTLARTPSTDFSPGAFLDAFPVSLLTTSTLARLTQLRPQSRFDARRFRMNVIVETGAPGFPENGWVGREVRLGTTARLRVTQPDPRCVMTSLAQEDLPADPEILRTLARHNRLQIDGSEVPCAGVYAQVTAPGPVRAGAGVALLESGPGP